MKNKQHSVLTELGKILIEAEIARQQKAATFSQVSEAQESVATDEPSQNKSTRLEDSKPRRAKVQTAR